MIKEKNVLPRITKTKKGTEHKESDHNLIETRLRLNWNKDEVQATVKVFNLKNDK